MTMERALSLVLDRDAKISLTLERMEAKDLDKYVSKNFTSSEDVRKKYGSVITKFLGEHQELIKKVETDNNKYYAGSIVITELQDDLTIKKIKVLYKKDIRIFKEITKNKKFVLALENRDYINYINTLKKDQSYKRLFVDYYAKELRFRSSDDKKFARLMGSWREAIKESKYYYEIVRTVLKEYDGRYKELNLDSPTVVYSKYMEEKSISKKNKELEKEIESLEQIQNGNHFELDLLKHENDYKKVEPRRYKTYADEEEYPGDLEDLHAHNDYSNFDDINNEDIAIIKVKTFLNERDN